MKRILLKLSGEALAGAEKKGFDEATVIAVAKQIRAVAEEVVIFLPFSLFRLYFSNVDLYRKEFLLLLALLISSIQI